MEGVVSSLRSVTSDALQPMARRLFVNNELSIALTGPNDETERLKELAAAF